MNNPPAKRPRPLVIGLIAFVLIAASYALWSHFQHSHGHGHSHEHGHDHDHDHGAAALALNDGKRWETDEALRLGMQRIRDAVALQLNGGNGHNLPAVQAKVLADAVQENVSYLIQNCKLAPEADANLHVIINDLMVGASLLTAGGQSGEGLAKLAHALQAYPAFFNHPNWHPLPEPKA